MGSTNDTQLASGVVSLPGSCAQLSVEELCDRLAASLERARVAEWLACQLLAELADRFDRRAPELGAYQDVYQLARLRFDMGVRQARERVRIGRSLRALPEVSRAFVDGRLGYARVREVTRVATPESEGAWLDLAEALPLRTLERRVVEATEAEADGETGPGAKPTKALEPACVRWTSSKTVEVRFELPAAAWAVVARALEDVRAKGEAALSDAEALEAVAREALSRAANDTDRRDVRRMVVMYSCATCGRAEIETGAGAVELDAAAAARVVCGAACVDLECEGRGHDREASRGVEIPIAVRRAVLLRDRMRCRAPGCTRRRWVDVHHVVPREQGGEHSRENCVTLCTGCHDRVHEGRLVVEGDAEGELRFGELGGGSAGMTPGGHGGEAAAEAGKVLEVIRRRRGAVHPDFIADGCGMPIGTVLALLFELEVEGYVALGIDGYSAVVGGAC